MAKEAATNAMKDAGVSYGDVEQVTVGYCYGKHHATMINEVYNISNEFAAVTLKGIKKGKN